MFATRRTFSFPVRTCLCSSDAQHALRQGQVLPSQPSPPTDTSFTTHLSCYHPAAVPKSFMNEAFVVVWSCTETARMPHKALNVVSSLWELVLTYLLNTTMPFPSTALPCDVLGHAATNRSNVKHGHCHLTPSSPAETVSKTCDYLLNTHPPSTPVIPTAPPVPHLSITENQHGHS